MAVTSRDRGAKDFLKRLAKQVSVRVGVFGDAAAEKHKDGNGATVGQIANAHEFGLGPPARSWARGTIDANKSKIEGALIKAFENVIIKRTMTMDQAMLQIGLGVAGLAQERVTSNIPPALSPRYLKRKLLAYPGATTALIASGQFRASITALVVHK